MSNAASSILESSHKITAPRLNKTKITGSVFVADLPSADGQNWGRECHFKRLNPTEDLMLVSAIRDGLIAMGEKSANREDFIRTYNVPELKTPEEREDWLNAVWTLQMCMTDPIFTFEEAVSWYSSDEIQDVPVGEVAKFLLFKIRSLNSEMGDLQDVSTGIETLRKMPEALGNIENAYLAGPETLRRFLENDDETTQFVQKWGGIIAEVSFGLMRKQAEIAADETSKAILDKFLTLLEEMQLVNRGKN